MRMASIWYQLGLPPQGEASAMLPLVSMVLQCFVVGALVGLWRYQLLRRRTNLH
jgi:hypothetical protein